MRRTTTYRPALLPILCLSALTVAVIWLGPATTTSAEEPKAEPAKDAVDQAIEKINKEDNGLTVNRKDNYVDVSAKVVLRAAEFLEMFACTPDSREHESILVLNAQPSMMHLSLLLLGQEPGKPLSYDRNFDPPKLVPATGPEVRVYIVTKLAGKEREIPANRWVKDNANDEMMDDNVWLFAGSVTSEFNNEKAYLADLNGSAISLVNFGDDLLTLPNKMTQDNASHGKVWAPRTEAIPKVGTEVTLRLRVKAPDANNKPEGQPKPADQPEESAKTQ